MRPQRCKQGTIVRVTIEFRDQEDKLPVAVVFRHGIGRTRIDAARYLPVGELLRGVPAEEIPGNVLVPKSQHGRGSQGAVTNPRASVGTRAGLESRPGT